MMMDYPYKQEYHQAIQKTFLKPGLNIECFPSHLTLIFNPKIANIAKIKSQFDV